MKGTATWRCDVFTAQLASAAAALPRACQILRDAHLPLELT